MQDSSQKLTEEVSEIQNHQTDKAMIADTRKKSLKKFDKIVEIQNAILFPAVLGAQKLFLTENWLTSYEAPVPAMHIIVS